MKRRRRLPHHNNEDRWLLTYSDLITLLLGLFVILYAISKVDAGKYAEIASALSGVFGSQRGVISVHPAVLDQSAILQSERQRIVRDVRNALQLDTQQMPITVTENERGVTVHIMEELLFASGSADIKASSLSALDTLAGVLRTLPNDLRVEGHTDNVPISHSAIPVQLAPVGRPRAQCGILSHSATWIDSGAGFGGRVLRVSPHRGE